MGALFLTMPAKTGSLAEKELLIGETSIFIRCGILLYVLQDCFLNFLSVPWGSKEIATDSQPVLPDGETEDLQPGMAEDGKDQSDVAPMEKLHGGMAMLKAVSFQKSVGHEKHMSRFKWCLGCWHFTRNLKILRTDSRGWDVRVKNNQLDGRPCRMTISGNPWRVLQVWELKIVKGIIQQLKHQLKICWSKQRTRCLL